MSPSADPSFNKNGLPRKLGPGMLLCCFCGAWVLRADGARADHIRRVEWDGRRESPCQRAQRLKQAGAAR